MRFETIYTVHGRVAGALTLPSAARCSQFGKCTVYAQLWRRVLTPGFGLLNSTVKVQGRFPGNVDGHGLANPQVT